MSPTNHPSSPGIRSVRTSLPTGFAHGVDPRTVMEILGHTTIRQTMDRYGHVLPERLRRPQTPWTRHSAAEIGCTDGCTTRSRPPRRGGDDGRAAGQAW